MGGGWGGGGGGSGPPVSTLDPRMSYEVLVFRPIRKGLLQTWLHGHLQWG